MCRIPFPRKSISGAFGLAVKKSLPAVAVLLLFAVTVFLVLGHFFVFAQVSHRQRELDLMRALNIQHVLAERLMEPVIVARVMAHDSFLIEALESESESHAHTDIGRIQPYLLRIKESFSYASACVISERTRRYYRDDEMHKIINPKKNAHDVWFTKYAEEGLRSNLSVYMSADVVSSTLFVNERIESESGEFLGVASVGVFVSDFLMLLSEYEAEYDLKISLVDESGLVMLATNYSDMSVASLAYLVQPAEHGSGLYYTHRGTQGFAVSAHLKELGWYVVVQGERGAVFVQKDQLFYPFAALLFALSLGVLFWVHKKSRPSFKFVAGNSVQVDTLTGLPNRTFFKNMYGDRGVFNTTRYRCLAVFDIDSFKEANDSMNGDEALMSVVSNALRLLNNRGMVLRWGGDEFLILFELPMESAYALCRQFCRDVEADGLVTISVGLVNVRLSDTIKKNYYRAAQCCYQVKEMGGNGVKKES